MSRKPKITQLIRMWWRITLQDWYAPLVSKTSLLQLIALVILYVVVLPAEGFEKWREEALNLSLSATALLYAVPTYLLLMCIVAIFKTRTEINNLGEWFGDTFVYHAPQHILTLLVSEKDNETTHKFKVKDANTRSLVEVLVEVDRNDERVKTQVVWPKGQNLLNWDVVSKATRVSLLLPNDRYLALRTRAAPEATLTKIRVFITSWRCENVNQKG